MQAWVLGSAGVGKSTLTGVLADALGMKKVNLDPAAKVLPYKPDFNIRKWIKVEEIMKNEKIGPNMAIIEAYKRIKTDMIPDNAVIDTPGQLDLFILSENAERIIKNGVGIFLIDCSKKSVEKILTQFLLYLVISLNLEIPVVYAISKEDECDKEFVMKVMQGKVLPSGNMAEIFTRIKIADLLPPQRPVFVSAKNGKGIEELIDLIHEAFCSCGDLS